MTITSLYPFLKNYLKISFCKPEAQGFFIQLMQDALSYREKHKIERADYLDYLLNLKKKKAIADIDIAGHAATFLIGEFCFW